MASFLNQLKFKLEPKKQEEVKVKLVAPSNFNHEPSSNPKINRDRENRVVDESVSDDIEVQPPARINAPAINKSKGFPVIRDLTQKNKNFDLQLFKMSVINKDQNFDQPMLPMVEEKVPMVEVEEKVPILEATVSETPRVPPERVKRNINTTKTKKVTKKKVKDVEKKVEAPKGVLKLSPIVEEKSQPLLSSSPLKKTTKKKRVAAYKDADDEKKEPTKNPVNNTLRVPTPVLDEEKGGPSSSSSSSSSSSAMEPEKKEAPGVLVDVDFSNRLKDYKYKLKQEPSYFMNNRKQFIEFITTAFMKKYKKELNDKGNGASCDSNDDDSVRFNPMAHQKIVRDYINSYSPYRGVLLYHGLGSGKTCSSIIIAEGMKTEKEIMILTPASLKTNYREELKKCGDLLYVKNQFWEFINTEKNPEYAKKLSEILSISVDTIQKKRGAWLVNMNKPSNYSGLTSLQKKSLDDQIDQMIDTKYKFISYNGLRKKNIKDMSRDGLINPFDNKVVIIDEAHNFVSRIVNKINTKKSDVMSIQLYEYLMEAVNVKIVLLSGTPIINYPNEIAVLFNILRGKIKTWTFVLDILSKNKNTISTEYFKSILKSVTIGGNVSDYIEYTSAKTLVITRNPYGFVNKTEKEEYAGVKIPDSGNRGQLTDDEFPKKITALLAQHDITVKGTNIEKHKLLPDKLDQFNKYFVENNEFSNSEMFKRRVLGLTSYFRSAQESLMPAYTKNANFHIVNIPMSDFQFEAYAEARRTERHEETQMAMQRWKKPSDDIYSETMTSSYRVYSRSFCNFVFPSPEIERPMLDKDIIANEDELDVSSQEEMLDNPLASVDADDLAENPDAAAKSAVSRLEVKRKAYRALVLLALKTLDEQKGNLLVGDNLAKLSPKFLSILNNIKSVAHEGIHLIYSQFRTLEGIGILKLVLEANGFAQLKIAQNGKSGWQLDMKEDDLAKPKFALYTGKETAKEKEIIRNIFNGNFKYVPESLMKQINEKISKSKNNMYGEFIKIIMISSSGAEGISLKNVRYVHITEPYWHPVRMEQVIGRARRICSHKDLPEKLRTVDVFLYLMNITEEQKKNSKELAMNDISRIDKKSIVTTDQTLYEISSIKEEISQKILKAVKESAFDCAIHSISSPSDEKLQCFSFGPNSSSSSFASVPSIENEKKDEEVGINREEVTLITKDVRIKGVAYAYDETNSILYDKNSIINKQPLKVGTLKMVDGKLKYTLS